jgi:hypothetical protein
LAAGRFSRKKIVDEQKLAQLRLKVAGNSSDLARLTALKSKRSGAFLNSALNFVSADTAMTNKEFQVAVKFRLGHDMRKGVEFCPKSHDPRVPFDRLCSHVVDCKINGTPIHRHDEIVDWLEGKAREAGLHVDHEPLDLIPGTQRRPADVFIHRFDAGRHVAIDVSVCNSVQPQSIPSAAVVHGHVAMLRARAKITKNAADLARQQISFRPFVIETYGAVHPMADSIVKSIAVLYAAKYNLPLSPVVKLFFVELSAILQRSVARAILSVLPNASFVLPRLVAHLAPAQ